MQHHFVVYFDDVTKTWHIDEGTTQARFEDGNVWSEKLQDWQDWNDVTDNAEGKLYDIFLDANEENK